MVKEATLDVLGIARQYGQAATSRALMPKLAMAVAEATLEGDVGEEDANDIYLVYAKRGPRVHNQPELDPRSAAFKAQASKLRQIIKLVEEHGKDGTGLLQRVMRLHEQTAFEKPVVPAYHAMVAAARAQLVQRGRLLSDEQIVKILTRRRGRGDK